MSPAASEVRGAFAQGHIAATTRRRFILRSTSASGWFAPRTIAIVFNMPPHMNDRIGGIILFLRLKPRWRVRLGKRATNEPVFLTYGSFVFERGGVAFASPPLFLAIMVLTSDRVERFDDELFTHRLFVLGRRVGTVDAGGATPIARSNGSTKCRLTSMSAARVANASLSRLAIFRAVVPSRIWQP
jgi:hypothetical protein